MVVVGWRVGMGTGARTGSAGLSATATLRPAPVSWGRVRGALNRGTRPDGDRDRLTVGADDLHEEEEADGVFLEAVHHGFEHVEGFALVGDERVLLGVAAEADAFFKVVHREQVVFPQAVEHAQHDHALVVAHGRLADDGFFGGVVFLELLEEGLAQFVAVHLGDVDTFGFEV